MAYWVWGDFPPAWGYMGDDCVGGTPSPPGGTGTTGEERTTCCECSSSSESSVSSVSSDSSTSGESNSSSSSSCCPADNATLYLTIGSDTIPLYFTESGVWVGGNEGTVCSQATYQLKCPGYGGNETGDFTLFVDFGTAENSTYGTLTSSSCDPFEVCYDFDPGWECGGVPLSCCITE